MQILLLLATFISTCLGFSRIIVQTQSFDTVDNNLFTILDVNLTKAVTSKLYTRQEADLNTQKSLRYMLDQFGLDFSSGFFNPELGSYHLPNAGAYPYGTGYDSRKYVVSYDSSNNNYQQPLNQRSAVYSGYLVVMTQSGTFSSGLSAGQRYNQNDVLARLDVIHIKDNEPYPPRKQFSEIFDLRSRVPGPQTVNGQGYLEQWGFFDVFDEAGSLGLYIHGVTGFNDANGKPHLETRTTLTWK